MLLQGKSGPSGLLIVNNLKCEDLSAVAGMKNGDLVL